MRTTVIRQLPLASIGGMALLLASGCAREDAATPETMDDNAIMRDADGAVATKDGSTESPDDEKPRSPDAGNPSTGGSHGRPTDAGSHERDAGPLPNQGTCDAQTPHGCYVSEPGNHPMCPEHSPEQSASYPPNDEWEGCNGIMPEQPFGLDPKAKCTYRSPQGQLATCVCDTGLHWLCSCGTTGVGGIGQWPDCTTP